MARFGLAIGDEETAGPELEENLRTARALRAKFVNARIDSEPLRDRSGRAEVVQAHGV